ncbi:hypothetical protein WJX81_006429 [Elliptochloris bilobata]|uniref:Uncharacterized protein n=1 Tax=Elliptochloris bilobata TaxID=381761 RepID=A0AAW1S9Q1_9CHLO
MDFSGGASSSSAAARPSDQQIMDEVSTQVTLSTIQEFLTTARDKCFQRSTHAGSDRYNCAAFSCSSHLSGM